MSRLNTFVHVHDADGVSHAFGPGDTVPGWAVDLITNPGVWAEAPVAPVVKKEAPAKPRAARSAKSV
jgi:hypothetical protein